MVRFTASRKPHCAISAILPRLSVLSCSSPLEMRPDGSILYAAEAVMDSIQRGFEDALADHRIDQ